MSLVRRTIERYVKLTDAEWALVEPHWQPRDFPKGAFITRTGDVEPWFSIVEKGVQRLFIEHDGAEVCVGFAYDGSWSGVYDSFVTRTPSRFAVQAVTDSRLWSIRREALYALYDTVPAMDRWGRLILEELLIGRATREIEQLTLDAEARYRKLIARSPHLLQLVAQKDIASYLRMTPETFSRLRARVR
ncbi:MAG: Crp/Fnr family transcriptional regulator [Flavobacteriales bacterium]|nr:Crp/Fnr family transcriptional regulator [Flavobacteriales bacterium]